MFSSDTFADPVSKLCNQIIQTGDLFVFVCVCLCVCVCVCARVCVVSWHLDKKVYFSPRVVLPVIKVKPWCRLRYESDLEARKTLWNIDCPRDILSHLYGWPSGSNFLIFKEHPTFSFLSASPPPPIRRVLQESNK